MGMGVGGDIWVWGCEGVDVGKGKVSGVCT